MLSLESQQHELRLDALCHFYILLEVCMLWHARNKPSAFAVHNGGLELAAQH